MDIVELMEFTRARGARRGARGCHGARRGALRHYGARFGVSGRRGDRGREIL